MGWKATGEPTVRRQRDRWVVRVDGIDTETGKHRPKQLGTYPSQRAATVAARSAAVDGRAGPERGTVSWLVRRWVSSRTDVSQKTREQYEWAATHIESGLGGVRLDLLDREDVARWLESLASGGRLSHRSISICRTVLRAALADGVQEGLLRRSPAARVAMPRDVVRPGLVREVGAWTENQVHTFLAGTGGHRWAAAFRLAVLFGLRRSEVLALRWDDLNQALETVTVDEGLVTVRGGVAWTNAKNARSRRSIPLDPGTLRLLSTRRREQAEDRLLAGPQWEDHDLIFTTRTGRPVLPRSFDRGLRLAIEKVGNPRLSSHGLRHTAATHMVRHADDVGELRAAADVLGHSPDLLMRIYAHTLPESLRAVTAKIAGRAAD